MGSWRTVREDDYEVIYSKTTPSGDLTYSIDLFLVAFDGTWWRGIHHGETIVKGRVKDNVINQSEQWMDEHE